MSDSIDSALIKEHTNRLVGHHLDFNGSYKSLESMSKIINQTPNASIQVPYTKYCIKKMMQPLFKTETHIKCHRCSNYIPSFKSDTECESCNVHIKTSISDYFIYIPIKQQVENSIKDNFNEILTYHSKVMNSNKIDDIQNEECYINAQKKYAQYVVMPLIINTDGVKIHKSSTDSLWMIQAYQGYLPPSKRFLTNNIIIIAARFSKTKPSVHDFFYPLLHELSNINKECGITIKQNSEVKHFMPLIISACCDLPAKCDLQGITSYSGKYGCGYCLHPGIPIKSDVNNTSTIRYLKGSYATRTHAEFLDTYKRLDTKQPINGIKTLSCMVSANEFDLVHGFGIDQMHCAELGIMKKMLSLWLDTKNHSKPYYIKKKIKF